MSTPLKVGITMRITDATGYRDVRDTLSHDWTVYLEANGIIPVLIPSSTRDVRQFLEFHGVKHIILSNGNDVGNLEEDPSKEDELDYIRDQFEKKVMKVATEDNLPVLGVCRGFQFLNVYFGGAPVNGLKSSGLTNINHAGTTHEVDLIHPKLQQWAGSDIVTTNSFHDNGASAESLSGEFTTAAHLGPVVEAMVHQSGPWMGIQWHPERHGSCSTLDKAILQSFKNGFEDLT